MYGFSNASPRSVSIEPGEGGPAARGENDLRAHWLHARFIPELEFGSLVGHGQIGPRCSESFTGECVRSVYGRGSQRRMAWRNRLSLSKNSERKKIRRRLSRAKDTKR